MTAGARTSQVQRLAYGIGILLLLSLMCAPFFRDTIATGAPRADAGRIAFEGWSNWDRPVQLSGTWRLSWRANAFSQPVETLAPVPSPWKGVMADGTPLPAYGQGIYRLTLTGLPRGMFRLHVPSLFVGSEVWINDRFVSARGRAGTSADDTAINVRPHEVWLFSDARPQTIEIRISSYVHRDNGLESAPTLGRDDPMIGWSGLEWAQEFLFHISLVLLTIFGLVVFLFRREDRASLYFALSCLFFQPASAIIGYDNMLLMAFPSTGFATMLAIHYISGIFCVALFLAYAVALFPDETPRFVRFTFAPVFALFLLMVSAAFVAGDTLLASRVYTWFMLLALVSLTMMVIIVARAARRGRDGAVIFLVGVVFFALMILALTLVNNGFVTRERAGGLDLTAYGMLLLLFSHIIILAERWSVAMDETRQTNADLRSLLDLSSSVASEMQLAQLLGKIVEVASRIVQAERSSLFLHDLQKHELWSLVAQGDGVGEIRMPDDQGIAGAAFSLGEAVNVPDAYADNRFNQAVDRETGFRTRTILAMPVIARDGRKLGVMQALNREGGAAFSDNDAARMAAFVAQAAVSIDNATLFSEVVSSRNYNDSILASMSSGVVTFDPQVRIAKFNTAARRILRMPDEHESAPRTRWSLETNNSWLIAEIAGVSVSGQSKTMLDIELVAADGAPVSANVTIIPLVSEGSEVGILILIEDISEGKRLQGAMRRFMPQKVVDQVLDRDDELLFGSACRASVLFADIRNFTSMSETLGARETVDMLNEVFTDLFEAVASTDGILDKYIGDAIMAVYGVPFAGERDARNSVDAGIAMVQMIAEINKRRAIRGHEELRLGVGIATGDVVAGTIGSPKRMDYTVIGDSVNLASRLQDITKPFRAWIIICAETAAQVGETHRLRELDCIRVRGRQQLERIYEVMIPGGIAEGATLDALISRYAAGRALLDARQWQAALHAFDALLADFSRDGPAALMRDRAARAVAAPPSDDWDGVW